MISKIRTCFQRFSHKLAIHFKTEITCDHLEIQVQSVCIVIIPERKLLKGNERFIRTRMVLIGDGLKLRGEIRIKIEKISTFVT
jgi:hypothetical protein